MLFRSDYPVEPEIAQEFDNMGPQPMDEEPDVEEQPFLMKKKVKEDKASKNSRKENEGAPRGRPRQKKVVLREGTHSNHRLYAFIPHT